MKLYKVTFLYFICINLCTRIVYVQVKYTNENIFTNCIYICLQTLLAAAILSDILQSPQIRWPLLAL